MAEEKKIYLDRAEYALFAAGVKQGNTSTLVQSAGELRKAREHYSAQEHEEGVNIAPFLSVLEALAKQFDTEAKREGECARMQLDYALSCRPKKPLSLQQKCKNAIIGFVEGYKREA